MSKILTSNPEQAILEEPWMFERYWQIRLEKWPPTKSFSGLYVFWQRGKKADFDFFMDFLAKTDMKVLWWYDDMMIWWYDHMIIWWYDHMIIWSFKHMIHMIIWSYDIMVIAGDCW